MTVHKTLMYNPGTIDCLSSGLVKVNIEVDFFEQIKRFNEMYNLPNNDTYTDQGNVRANNFFSILKEELEEIGELEKHTEPRERATIVADLLGDIIVYCASEARRWGIPIEQVLDIIMESNFSKLDTDGKPLYDERGKVLKGPNYWSPNDKIKELFK